MAPISETEKDSLGLFSTGAHALASQTPIYSGVLTFPFEAHKFRMDSRSSGEVSFSQKKKQDFATKVFNKKFPFLRNKKYYLFLGRIDEKKGLDIAVQSINLLGDNFKGLFVIVGDYKNSCGLKIEKLIKKLKLENKILLLGHLEYYLKNILITNSKAMILSSHAENFAISLVESLSCARPVLTTYKVNIFNKILKYKAGYVAQENPISFSKILSKFEALNSKEKLQMSINASKCFNNEFNLANKKYFIPSLENNLNE